ncbi:hypothetical protein B0T11DRAFT_273854 [Plectosphaerella cucumerina]|uniref:Zn(2)-C6 fungal-type domain-containing protein n=1 Tax=Plectosphaerella cucumerina TaxID=40658 RepID=A0A8K0TUR9_9PEZI|nr:hypothetical protein B0T11DRAFT_273854 [Plectosphaerella cucumerina]
MVASNTHVSHKVPRKKRDQVSVACDPCRRRKVKCNAQRPRCRRCQANSLDCAYQMTHKDALLWRLQQLDRSNAALDRSNVALDRCNAALERSNAALDVLHALQSWPEAEAMEMFCRIRAGADLETIMRHISAANALLQVNSSQEQQENSPTSMEIMSPVE